MLGILDCTQTVFIAAGFRRECGKIYKMSLECSCLYEMEKRKCVSACVSGTWCTCECAWLLFKDISPLNTEKNQTMSYFFRCCLWEITSDDSGLKRLVWHKPQYKTTNNTLPAKQSA